MLRDINLTGSSSPAGFALGNGVVYFTATQFNSVNGSSTQIWKTDGTPTGTVPVTAKITRSLPASWGLLAVPVVVKVTVPASASFDTSTHVTGTYLWLSSTVKGKSNVTTKVSYTLIGL